MHRLDRLGRQTERSDSVFLQEPMIRLAKKIDTPTTVEGLQETYTFFEPIINELHDDINWDSPQDHPNYLGESHFNYAYSLPVDGESIAVRFPIGDEGMLAAHERAEALVQGTGIELLEQGLSFSPTTGIIVSTKAPGVSLERANTDELLMVTPGDIDLLFDVVLYTSKQRIALDMHESNLFIKDGFHLIDYRLANNIKPNPLITASNFLHSLAEVSHQRPAVREPCGDIFSYTTEMLEQEFPGGEHARQHACNRMVFTNYWGKRRVR